MMRIAFLVFLVTTIITGLFLRNTEEDSESEQFWGVGFLFSLFMTVTLTLFKVWR